MNLLIYKSFYGCPKWSADDAVYHCRIRQVGNDDLISCEGDTLEELEQAFRESADEYLEWVGELE